MTDRRIWTTTESPFAPPPPKKKKYIIIIIIIMPQNQIVTRKISWIKYLHLNPPSLRESQSKFLLLDFDEKTRLFRDPVDSTTTTTLSSTTRKRQNFLRSGKNRRIDQTRDDQGSLKLRRQKQYDRALGPVSKTTCLKMNVQ